MKKTFKEIIFNIAKLPKRDQIYIIKNLSKSQKLNFTKLNGESLLKQAFKFRNLNYQKKDLVIKEVTEVEELPTYAKELSINSPLYIAIILDKLKPNWQNAFLKQFDEDNMILNLMHQKVPNLKEKVKEAGVSNLKTWISSGLTQTGRSPVALF